MSVKTIPIHHSGFSTQIPLDPLGPGHVLAGPGLGKEGLEGVVPEGLVGGHVAVGLDAMFEAVELPAGVSDLATSLADVDGDALTLGRKD